jgi:hypothetical protein
MRLNKVVAIPAIALAADLSLSACGSTTTLPVITHTVTAPAAAPKPTTPAPTTPAPTTAAPVAPAPAKTVYVAPAAPAAPVYSGANCGGGVYAGPNTSCAFALNVAADYSSQGPRPYASNVYSPVTGQSYWMTYTESNGVITATGGNNASVQFPG